MCATRKSRIVGNKLGGSKERLAETSLAERSWYAGRPALLLVTFASLLLVVYYSGGVTRTFNHFAETEIAKRNFDSANKWLAFSTWIAPDSPEAHFLLARIGRHEGNAAKLSGHLQSASRLGFNSSRVRLEELLSSAQSGRLKDVETELSSRLAAGDPDAAEICDAYANGLAKESRFDEALQILQAWSNDRPSDAVPYYRIGRIQEHLQKLEDAKRNYKQAIEKDPHYYPAVYSLARMNLDENNASEAAVYFEKCLAMPNALAAKTGLGLSLVKLGDAERAIALLQEVQNSDPALVRNSYASLNESIERNVAACELGKLYQTQGKLDDAIKVLDVALRDNPRDLTARYTRALVLKSLQREEEANSDFALVSQTKAAMERVNVLRNKINRDNNDVESRIELGKLLITFESERNGLFWLRSALQVKSDSVDVHRALAEYYESRADESTENWQLAKQHRKEANDLQSLQDKN